MRSLVHSCHVIICVTVRSLVHSCHVIVCVTARLLISLSALYQFCFTVIIDPLLLHSSPCSSSSISCRDPSSLGNIPQLVVCKKQNKKKKKRKKKRIQFVFRQDVYKSELLRYLCYFTVKQSYCFVFVSLCDLTEPLLLRYLCLMVIIALTLIALFPKEEICNMIT